MQSIIRLIIFALAMLAFGGLRAQTIIGQGNATTITYQKGGIGADSMVKIPYRDTTALYAGYTKCGRITIRPQDGQLYVHDCLRWVAVGSIPDSFASKRYVDSIVATIVAGTVDSNLYATVTRLGDSIGYTQRAVRAWYYGLTDDAIEQASTLAGNYGTIDGGGRTYIFYNKVTLLKGQRLFNAHIVRADEIATTISSNYVNTDAFFTVATVPSGWNVGDAIQIYAGDHNNQTVTTRQITSISNDTVYIDNPYSSNFSTGAGVRKTYDLFFYPGHFDTTSENLLVPVYATFQNVEIDGNKVNNSGNFGWQYNNTIKGAFIKIQECSFMNIPNENIQVDGVLIEGCEANNLNGSFVHWSASQAVYNLTNLSNVVRGNRMFNTNLEAAKNEHGEAAIEHSFTSVNMTITDNYIYNCNYAIDNFIASAPADPTYLPPRTIIFSNNTVRKCRGAFMTSPEFLLDGSSLLRKGGFAVFSNNLFDSCGNGNANDWTPFQYMMDSLFDHIGWFGNILHETQFVIPNNGVFYSDVSGKYGTTEDLPLTFTQDSVYVFGVDYDGLFYIGYPLAAATIKPFGAKVIMQNNDPALGNTLAFVGDPNANKRTSITFAKGFTGQNIARWILDSLGNFDHRSLTHKFSDQDDGSNSIVYTPSTRLLSTPDANYWSIGANNTALMHFNNSGYVLIGSVNPNLTTANTFQIHSNSGMLINAGVSTSIDFTVNNTRASTIKGDLTNPFYIINRFGGITGNGQRPIVTDTKGFTGFYGVTAPTNPVHTNGSLRADTLRMINPPTGSANDSIVVYNNTDGFLKSLRPANQFLLKSDSSIYTPKYRHDTLATNVYSAIAAGGSGTVTSVSATDGTELDFTVTNPTTTPNISAVLIAGSIANSKLANSTISGVALGSNLNTLTISSPLTGTSYNGSAGVSIGIQDAAADNTTKGAATFNNDDFEATAGVVSIDYDNGTQSSATSQGFLSNTDWILFNDKVAATRAINSGWGINGGGDLSADRTLFLDSTEAATRSDIDTLAAGVYSAFSGSGGTVTSFTFTDGNGFDGTVTNSTTTPTLSIALQANTNFVTDAEKTVIGNTSGTNTGDQTSVTGNAGTATALQNTRTIWGQNFNGTANVTGDLALGASNLTMTGSIAATGSRVTKGWFTDIESTNPPTVGGTALPTATSTTTFTNKRITPRITTTASSATPTPDADASDMFTVTALAAGAVFAAPTGTPTDGQGLLIRIKDNGTARSLGWNATYRGGTDIALPTTTVISKTMYVQFIYNSADTKWDLVGLTDGL